MRATARALLADGDADAASVVAEDITTEYGDSPADAVFLAACFRKADNDPGAEIVLRQCVADWPDHAPGHLALAQLLSGQGRAASAIAEAKAAVQADPGFVKAAYFLGWLCRKAADPSGERDAFKLAAEADPSDAKAHLGLASACMRLGDEHAALNAARAALALDPESRPAQAVEARVLASWRRRARALEANGQTAEALVFAGQIIVEFGEAPEDAVFLAHCLKRNGDTETAATVYAAATTLAPDTASVRTAHARFLADQGKISEALIASEAAMAADPTSTAAPLIAAGLQRQAGDTQKELDAFRRAIEADPQSVRALAGAAAAAHRLGNHDAALRFADRALAVDPGFPLALRVRAIALSDVGAALEEVKAAYDQAIAAAPDDLLLRRLYADACLAREDVDGAVLALSNVSVVTDDPYELTRAYARCANILAQAGDVDRAEGWARQATRAADRFNQQTSAEAKVASLLSDSQGEPLRMPKADFEQAMITASASARQIDGAVDWALQRMRFGHLAAAWSLIASMAGPNMPDPWRDLVDDSELIAFLRDRKPGPVLLAGGHIGPPVALQNSFSRRAPEIHCLSSNAAFWLSRNDSSNFIHAKFPQRAALTVFDRLRSGGAVFVGADGLLGARGLRGEAFGMRTDWPNGAATLARKASAPVHGCHALWDGGRIRVALVPGPDPLAFATDEEWMAAFACWYGNMLQTILTEDPANYRPGSHRYFGLEQR